MMNVINFKGMNITGFECPVIVREPILITVTDDNKKSEYYNLIIKGYETDVHLVYDYDTVEISLEELIGIINSIEGRETGNELSGVCDEVIEDCKIIQKGFKNIGIDLSLRECEVTHIWYSESYCASWLGVGDEACIEEEIYFVLTGIIEAINYDTKYM